MTNSYIETIRKYYPEAILAKDFEKSIISYLREQGYEPQEILAACSVCSDDVNAMQFSIQDTGILGPFYLGGLDGFPFTGLTGISAFTHHMPDNGGLLVYFGPHIGITEKGDLGKIIRQGQDHPSTCCGAADAALKRINDAPTHPSILDYQQDKIVAIFQQRRKQILDAPFPIKEATAVMYTAIFERLMILMEKTMPDLKGKYIIWAGCIFINTDHGFEACVSPEYLHFQDKYTKSHEDKLDDFKKYITQK